MASGNRRRGREFALKMVYGLFDGKESIEAGIEDFWNNFRFQDDILGEPIEQIEEGKVHEETRRFANEIVRGVAAHLDEIDGMIGKFSTNWSLERMARVDLALLRMTTFELLYRSDIPANVAINEAIEIGKRYGSKETPAFVNGILDKISHISRTKAV